MKILIVDDTPDNRIILKHILKKSGFENVDQAASAREAFERLGLDDPGSGGGGVDLILMDIMMPEIDGIEASRRIKEEMALKDIPIIMVTAMDDMVSLQSAFDAGAMDYITKPVNRVELLARVRSALTLKTETDRRKARENDIADIGAKIQQTLLFGRPPDDLAGIKIAARSFSSQRVDGDFYDFYRHNDRCIDILIADVMGKGTPAALLGAAAKTHFLRSLTDLVMISDRKTPPFPRDIVQSVHNQMSRELMDLGSFITFCYARVDGHAKRVVWVDGGHTKTVHFHSDTGATTLLEGENVPLGFSDNERYDEKECVIQPGDVLVFYSDGITEARNTAGEFFGEKRLCACILARSNLYPDALVAAIREDVVGFSGSNTFADDLTCVVVKLENSPEGFSGNQTQMEFSSDLGELSNVRKFIRNFCARRIPATPGEASVAAIEIAIHETVANIIRHGMEGETGKSIRMEAEYAGGQLTVRFCYHGKPYRPAARAKLPGDEYSESGYGRFIIEHYVDKISYTEDSQGMNCTVIEKTI